MMQLPFKKLQVWQRAMDLVNEIYKITKQFPKEEIFCLTSQMRRSAVSIPSNIAEGSQRISDKEFSNFILISRGSLAELETQAILAEGFGYIPKDIIDDLSSRIQELQKMLNAFYSKLTANR